MGVVQITEEFLGLTILYIKMEEWESLEAAQKEQKSRTKRKRWLASALLVAAICGLVTAPLINAYWRSLGRSQHPASTVEVPPTRVNRLAYITLDRQLATIAPDGSGNRRLTAQGEAFQFPAWSPDGITLAVIGGNSIFTLPDRANESENSTQLRRRYRSAEEPPFYLFWSPDGRHLSFLANHADGIGLHLIRDLRSSEASSALLAVGQPFYWDWLPSGEQLLIHSGFSGRGSRLALLDLEGGSDGQNVAEPGFFQAPAISFDGLLRAFSALDEAGAGNIVVQTAEADQRISRPHLGQVALAWSPTAQELAYISPAAEGNSFYGPLHLLNAVTGDERVLSEAVVIAYFWSPDGRSIAFLTSSDRGLGGGVQAASYGRQLSKPVRQDGPPRLALWVVDVGDGSVRHLTNFQPTRTFLTQFLPFFDQYALSHRIWSPDSDALVLPMADQGTPHIFVVPIAGSPAQVVTAGEIAFWSQQ